MSSVSAKFVLLLCLFATNLPARASLSEIFGCWVPVFLGSQSRTGTIPTINYNTVENSLLTQVNPFLYQQQAIVDLVRYHFSHGAKLRELLSRSQGVLKPLLREFPTPNQYFQEAFGERRVGFDSMSFYGSHQLPRVPSDRIEFLHQANVAGLRERLAIEMGGSPLSLENQRIYDTLWAVRAARYHTLEHQVHTAMYTYRADPTETEDNYYYISFPDDEMVDAILKDAEDRIERTRILESHVARQEQFLTALYGYTIARPYITGNQTIGWPVFAGIYQALMGRPLPGLFSGDNLLRLSSLSQGHFVETMSRPLNQRR